MTSEVAARLASAAPVIAALIVRLGDGLRRGCVADRKAAPKAFVSEVLVKPDEGSWTWCRGGVFSAPSAGRPASPP